MARKRRFNVADLPQHIRHRGNNRQPCFVDDEDRRRYLADLAVALDAHEVDLHAWVLMSNHVHLLATPRADTAVSGMMQMLGRRYVRWFNDRHERTGTLWEGRFRASPVDTDAYLLACMRYIELNPLRACMVRHPGEYRWSSFAANALGLPDPLVTPHPVYLALRSTRRDRIAAYRRLCGEPLGEDLLAAIREAADSGLVLGSEHFKDRIEAATALPARRRKNGRPRGAAPEATGEREQQKKRT
jgi:putative transposase